MGTNPSLGGRGVVDPDVELFEREWFPLKRLAYLLTYSEPIAEELVQEAFARYQAAKHRVVNPGGYLRTSVVNLARSHQRHRAVVERTLLPRAEAATQPADELFDVLRKLGLRQRAALVMRFHLDWPDNEIASALGCRPATVRSLINRGLKTLRKELEQ